MLSFCDLICIIYVLFTIHTMYIIRNKINSIQFNIIINIISIILYDYVT